MGVLTGRVDDDLLRFWVQGILDGDEKSAKCPLDLIIKEFVKLSMPIKIIASL